jgi:endonuclease/exonuclease/phosphatase (EEP) superfamily protein YafD
MKRSFSVSLEIAHRLVQMLAGTFFVLTLGHLFFPQLYFVDLYSNFLATAFISELMLLLLGVSLWQVHTRHRKSILISSLLLVMCLVVQGVFSLKGYELTSSLSAQEVTSSESLSVMSANTFKYQQDARDFLAYLASSPADFVAVIELNQAFEEQLSDLTLYPFKSFSAAEDGSGIGLLSKYPFDTVQAGNFPGGLPYRDVQLYKEGQHFQIIVVHPVPPISQEMYHLRNQSLEMIPEMMNDDIPSVVMGDFNLTPWSFYYRKLLDDAQLKSIRSLSYGLQNTWSSKGLWIPIDHILVDHQLIAQRHQVGPDIGSDHLPVFAQLIVQDSAKDGLPAVLR